MSRGKASLLIALSLAWCLTEAGAAGKKPPSSEVSKILIVVAGGPVSPVIRDQKGRRTGWNRGQELREIPGCSFSADYVGEYSSEFSEGDTAEVDSLNSEEATPSVPPEGFSFELSASMDQAGLLSKGGCELLLDPLQSGVEVLVQVSGWRGGNWEVCHASRSDTLRAPRRLLLEWRPAGDSCVTKIGMPRKIKKGK